MIGLLLANTAAADPMISGNWIIAVIGALSTAAAAIIAKAQGRKEAQATRLESPVPEVPTRKVSTPPSYDAHRALVDRVTRLETDVLRMGSDIKEMREEQSEQFGKLMTAGAERQLLISEKMEAIATGIHRRIDEMIQPARRTRQ